MKQYFILAALCLVSLLGGCTKEEEGGGRLIIDGIDATGTWAVIGSVWDNTLYYDENDEVCCTWQEGDRVEDLIVFTPTTIRGYSPTDEWYDKWYENGVYPNTEKGFVFSNGYMQGCSMSDFMEYGENKFTVENGRLYVSGVHIDLRFEGNDIVTWYDANGAYERYKRVKGFR